MNEGDIVLAALPQADGQIKNRPAVLPRQHIRGSIGTISPERHRRLLRRLSAYLIDTKPDNIT
ncbi:MAG: hypothetical protein MAG431_01568 [Chloroflexi bacterium]|nr:hypothetical protein [Chloroflexota bacterium]